MSDKLKYILKRLPEFYNTNDTSKMFIILNHLSNEIDNIDDSVIQLDNTIGIDTTTGSDLDTRWGSMLGISRQTGETDINYRDRLKLSISNLAGGTSKSIQYGIGVILGINNNQQEMDDRIIISDSWDYDGIFEITNIGPGYAVAEVDVNFINISQVNSFRDSIINIINDLKACGINIHTIIKGYYIDEYSHLNTITYNDLTTMTYGNMGLPTLEPILDVIHMDTYIHLSWAFKNQSGITSYKIYRNGILLTTITDKNITTYDDTSIIVGNTYEYYVKGLYKNGDILDTDTK